MMIGSQRFYNATPLHERETGAINQAPFFVLTGSTQLPGFSVQDHIYMNDLDEGRRFQRLNKCYDSREIRSGLVSSATSSAMM